MNEVSQRLPAALPMEQGLLAWTKAQGPDMWHEMARGLDLTDPQATIDLLLAMQWITRQERCCRSTALLLLARMVAAGLQDGSGPAQLAPEAARVMCQHLHRRLAEGRFPSARFHLSAAQRALIDALFGEAGAMPLPAAVRKGGSTAVHPPHAFLGWRPVTALPAPALQLAA